MYNLVLATLTTALIVSGGIQGTTTDIESVRVPLAEHQAVETMRQVWDIEEGSLVEGATLEMLAEAEKKTAHLPEESEHKDNLEVIADAARAELTKPKLRLYGTCTITHYCWCAACNGRAGHPTASGVNPTVNHTVATASLPFGTKIMINGQTYVCEDRGVPEMWVDIFVASHAEADARGMYQAEVYIVE